VCRPSRPRISREKPAANGPTCPFCARQRAVSELARANSSEPRSYPDFIVNDGFEQKQRNTPSFPGAAASGVLGFRVASRRSVPGVTIFVQSDE